MKKITIALMVISLLATFSIVGFTSNTANHSITIEFSEFVRVALNSDSNITFTVDSSSAGELPPTKYDTTKRLYYLALIDPTKTTLIDVSLTSGTIPTSEYSLEVETTGISAAIGNPGSASADQPIDLSTGGTLITSIGPVATGTSETDGAALKYTLSFNTVPNPATDGEYTVTYTINDAS